MNTWCKRCAASAAETRKLRKALRVATGALRSTAGYEPLEKSLESHRCSEALDRIDKILGPFLEALKTTPLVNKDNI